MKQFTYILFIVIFFSCSNREVNKYHKSTEAVESKENYKITPSSVTHKYQGFATQKLQDYIELLKLKEELPELKDDIVKQLRSLSKDNIFNFPPNTTIENIHQVGEIEIIPDNLQKIKLKYILLSKTEKRTDSISAFIKSSTIILNGEKITSNKISFSKE